MRINFNRNSSCTMGWESGREPRWIIRLQEQFLLAHDIDENADDISSYLWSAIGVAEFVRWLTFDGYNVKYWESNFRINDNHDPIAYGIQFEDDCPTLIEAKLRHAD